MSATAPAPASRYREALRAVELFEKLPDHHLDRFLETGKRRSLGPGELLFLPGDPPERMYVLLDGVVEILRPSPEHPEPVPVAYLSPGESLGDMGLFTGAPRKSTGRVPERAEVLILDRATFLRVADSIPGFGMHVATVFAFRMERFIKQIRRHTRRELSGKVQFFDLPTVVQTLLTTQHTGTLVLLDSEGSMLGEVLLVEGKVERARCDLLEGEDAFFQIFLREGIHEFVFRAGSTPSPDQVSGVPIAMPAMNLLMEALRQVDELPRLRDRLPDPNRPYQSRTDRLLWEEATTRPAAHEVLSNLHRPRTLEDLVGLVHCTRFMLYQVAAELYETRQIA